MTLLEIMIVIFLITLITGAIGYNMLGTLDRGRVFRTSQAKEQLHDLLLICLADKGDAEAIAKNPIQYLKEVGLAKDPENLIKDGWKQPFIIKPTRDKTDFEIRSEGLEKYNKKKGIASSGEDDE